MSVTGRALRLVEVYVSGWGLRMFVQYRLSVTGRASRIRVRG